MPARGSWCFPHVSVNSVVYDDRIYWKYTEFGQWPYADASDDPIVIEHNKAYQEWRHATRVAGAALGRLKQLCKRAMP